MKSAAISLIADGIENPHNALVLIHAAAMFGSECFFRDRKHLAATWMDMKAEPNNLPTVTRESLLHDYSPVVALDNLEGAADIYGYRLPRGERPALVAGNERFGIAQDITSAADAAVATSPHPARQSYARATRSHRLSRSIAQYRPITEPIRPTPADATHTGIAEDSR